MELSSRVEYALLALLELSQRQSDGQPLTVGSIAANQSIPERSLDQVLMVLRRGGIVHSQRGVKGGYLLAKAPEQISLLDVVSLLHEFGSQSLEVGTDHTVEKTVVVMTCQQIVQAYQSILGNYSLQDLYQQWHLQQQVKTLQTHSVSV